MDFEEYSTGLAERYAGLSEEDKEKVRTFRASEEGKIMSYLLGDVFQPLLRSLATPKPAMPEKQGLAVKPKKK